MRPSCSGRGRQGLKMGSRGGRGARWWKGCAILLFMKAVVCFADGHGKCTSEMQRGTRSPEAGRVEHDWGPSDRVP